MNIITILAIILIMINSISIIKDIYLTVQRKRNKKITKADFS